MTLPPDWDDEEREVLSGLADQLSALRERHAGDPPPELLRVAHHGVLPDGTEQRVARHLEANVWSRSLLEGLEPAKPSLTHADEDRLLARIQSRAQREAKRTSPGTVWRAVAQVAALAAVLVLVARLPQWNAPLPSRPASGPTAVARSVENRPAGVAWVLPLAKPHLRLGIDWLIRRGESSQSSQLADLKAGFDAYQRDEFDEAARRLAPLTSRYPDSVELLLYLGVAQLFADNSVGARQSLAAAVRLDAGPFREDVSWYLAIAEERTGDASSARARLQTLCRAGGIRSKDACAHAERLQ